MRDVTRVMCDVTRLCQNLGENDEIQMLDFDGLPRLFTVPTVRRAAVYFQHEQETGRLTLMRPRQPPSKLG